MRIHLWQKKLLWGSIILIIVFFAVKAFYGTTFDARNFPLQKKWVAHLPDMGSVENLYSDGTDTLFVRTNVAIFAMSVNTGNFLWHHYLSWQTIVGPTYSKDGIVYLTDSKTVWALSQSDGSVLWQKHIPFETSQIVGVIGDYLSVMVGDYVYVYDAKTGSLIWNAPYCRGGDIPYLNEMNIYLPCGRSITARELSSGNVIWKWEIEVKYLRSTDFRDDVMYFSTSESDVTAIDLRQRHEIWSVNTEHEIHRVNIFEDTILVSNASQVCSLRKLDGKIMWCADNILNHQDLALMDDEIYIFDWNRKNIIALSLSTGEQIGILRLFNFNLFGVEKETMLSSQNLLIFGSDRDVFAFGK